MRIHLISVCKYKCLICTSAQASWLILLPWVSSSDFQNPNPTRFQCEIKLPSRLQWCNTLTDRVEKNDSSITLRGRVLWIKWLPLIHFKERTKKVKSEVGQKVAMMRARLKPSARTPFIAFISARALEQRGVRPQGAQRAHGKTCVCMQISSEFDGTFLLLTEICMLS